MRNGKKRQGVTLLALGAALGAAVYLNWNYSAQTAEELAAPAAVQADAETVAVLEPFTAAQPQAADKNYGEAQLVSISKSSGQSFFDEARLSRTKSRDEALDVLKKSLKSSSLTSEEKERLTQRLNAQLDSITSESEIESLIKAKGFVDSVVYIDGQKVHVTVMTENDGLTRGEVAQIRDIILSKCATTPQNITVVEVK